MGSPLRLRPAYLAVEVSCGGWALAAVQSCSALVSPFCRFPLGTFPEEDVPSRKVKGKKAKTRGTEQQRKPKFCVRQRRQNMLNVDHTVGARGASSVLYLPNVSVLTLRVRVILFKPCVHTRHIACFCCFLLGDSPELIHDLRLSV